MSFFFGGGAESERSAGISLRIQCLGGENCFLFFFFLGGSGGCAECWYFFADSVLGRGKLCPFFFGGGEQGLSGVLVFLYGFSAWEGKTVSFFLGGGAESERSAGISLRIQCLGGENCVLLFSGGGGGGV